MLLGDLEAEPLEGKGHRGTPQQVMDQDPLRPMITGTGSIGVGSTEVSPLRGSEERMDVGSNPGCTADCL